jgi:hypothetical protein
MAKLDFPTSPVLNQIFTQNGKTWRWDGTSWKNFNIASVISGGTGYSFYNNGDILVGAGSTFYRLPASTSDNDVLTIDTLNPFKVKWASIPPTSATSVQVSPTNDNISHFPVFVSSSNGSGLALSTDTSFVYSPSSNLLSVGSFSGSAISITNGSNYVSFVYSGSATTTYVLPENTPQSGVGKSVLSSTTSGVLSWIGMSSADAGSATTAKNLEIIVASSDIYHPILFTNNINASGSAVSANTTISFNPSSNKLYSSAIAITSTELSNSASSGALTIAGGVGIGSSLFVGGDLSVSGNMTVNGTITTINSTTLTVDDKNIELGSISVPTDITAEGGGITLKGSSDKYLNWYSGVGWSSSESFNIGLGQTFKIGNVNVITSTSLGIGITNSYLESVGTIKTGVWAGSLITEFYGGTGYQSYALGDILVGAGNTLIKQPVGSDNYVLTADSNSATGVTWASLSATGTTTIGTPTDGVYSDGFFDSWTNNTYISNAMDDINELLKLIAPARPNYLTGTSLDIISSPTYYTVKISAGLGTEWYQAGYGTGSSITRYYLSGTLTAATANSSTTFSAGSLVTSTYGTINFKTKNRWQPNGAGYGTIDLSTNYNIGYSNNNLVLSDLAVYNNIWTKANARIVAYTQPNSGYEGLSIAHTENSQETDVYEIWKDAWSASNPNPTFSQSATASTYSQTLKYLSGITYYTTGTGFSVYFKGAAGIYSSCYNATRVYGISATGLVTATGAATDPLYTDELDKSGSNHVRVSLNSSNASSFNKYLTVTLYKAHNTTATSNATINKYINTYTSLSTDTNEQFQDENYRRIIGTATSWDSTADLTNGNLMIRSGTLVNPSTYAAEYDAEFPLAAPHTYSGDQEYQRYFYKESASTGTFTFTGISGHAVSSYGSGSLNMLLYLEGESLYFDLGTLQGSNANDGSARNLAISAKTSATSTQLNWSLGTKSTGVSGVGNSGRYKLIVIYKNTNPNITRIQSS